METLTIEVEGKEVEIELTYRPMIDMFCARTYRGHEVFVGQACDKEGALRAVKSSLTK